MKKLLLVSAALAGLWSAHAQTINPSQIRPCTNGQVLQTVAGVTSCSNASSVGITSLTGPVTATGPGASASTITPTGVTAGTYGAGTVYTVNAAGQIVAAGSPFSASLTCGSISCTTVEAGVTTTNPATFTASYSNPTVPTSASISDGTHSTTLTTPFTSGSLAFSYCTVAQAVSSFTFTLTAVGNSQTQTPTRSITCAPRAFGGTGTGGSATSATASGNNAVLVGATGTLSISYLGTTCAGQIYNVTTSGTQYVYLLLPCNVSNPGGGSFTTPGPTVFAMNSPTTITYTNQYGVALASSYLYRSTNSYFDASNFIITTGN